MFQKGSTIKSRSKDDREPHKSYIVLKFIPLSTFLIDHTMKLMIVLLLNLYEHRKLNLLLVLHLSRFIEIVKRRWNTKCDRIFDDAFKNRCIILLTHPLSTLNELKSHAYCKWHNSSSHTTMIVMSSVSRSNSLLIRNNYERWDWVRTM